ncbi:MAG: hypothetical protein BRD44_06765 [Bacteroidetes bacterium QS_7_67_15]|nr:MAG: hypothetical protein BRD44_06765 [Bacteroidetes bacterium QS_7_67_15]
MTQGPALCLCVARTGGFVWTPQRPIGSVSTQENESSKGNPFVEAFNTSYPIEERAGSRRKGGRSAPALVARIEGPCKKTPLLHEHAFFLGPYGRRPASDMESRSGAAGTGGRGGGAVRAARLRLRRPGRGRVRRRGLRRRAARAHPRRTRALFGQQERRLHHRTGPAFGASRPQRGRVHRTRGNRQACAGPLRPGAPRERRPARETLRRGRPVELRQHAVGPLLRPQRAPDCRVRLRRPPLGHLPLSPHSGGAHSRRRALQRGGGRPLRGRACRGGQRQRLPRPLSAGARGCGSVKQSANGLRTLQLSTFDLQPQTLMADVDITQPHAMSRANAKVALERVAQDLEAQYGIPYHWDGDTLRFKGKGADGHLDVTDDAARLSIGLNFLLRNTVGADRIRREAEQMLEKHLAQEA